MKFAEKIIGENIKLERAKPTFKLARELFAVADASRDTLLPWLSWALTNKKPEDEFNYLLNWCDKHWKDGEGYSYVVRQKKDGSILGMIDFMKIDTKDKSGEIGYWLGKDVVGNGYMHEAVKLLEKEIFAHDFNRIVIGNDTRNIRSANVAKRAGYHLDGVMRQNHWSEIENRFIDSNVWSKLRGEE